MANYQLSRLYYFFSSSSTNTKQEYSKWIFITIYSFIIISVLNNISAAIQKIIFRTKICKYNNNMEYIQTYTELVEWRGDVYNISIKV